MRSPPRRRRVGSATTARRSRQRGDPARASRARSRASQRSAREDGGESHPGRRRAVSPCAATSCRPLSRGRHRDLLAEHRRNGNSKGSQRPDAHPGRARPVRGEERISAKLRVRSRRRRCRGRTSCGAADDRAARHVGEVDRRAVVARRIGATSRMPCSRSARSCAGSDRADDLYAESPAARNSIIGQS